jgi:hypothetical protein
MKKYLLLSLTFLSLFFTSCKEDDDVSPTMSFDVMLSGKNEVPANNSTASGMIMGTYNTETMELMYTLTYSGVTATAAHFHKAAAGSNGGVEFDLGAISSGLKGTKTLTAAQAADLKAGMWYLNLHSAANPSGELRGQIMLK